MTIALLNAKALARRKMPSVSSDPSGMGAYNHEEQRRWIGQDPGLTAWAMKSDTSFDNEQKDPD